MPVYLFKCRKCGYQEEQLMSIYSHEDRNRYRNILPCPECDGFMCRVFTPFAIIGGEWDWKKGYRTGVNDSPKEVKYDMMRLEQSMTQEGNLKKYYEKKRALAHFAEANEDLLST